MRCSCYRWRGSGWRSETRPNRSDKRSYAKGEAMSAWFRVENDDGTFTDVLLDPTDIASIEKLCEVSRRGKGGERPMEYTETTFGKMLRYPIPSDCDCVIVCIDTIQHQPILMLLPHQVYVERMRELLAKHPDARGISILPVRSKDRISVSRAELQEGGE